jgi:hypothetical protein
MPDSLLHDSSLSETIKPAGAERLWRSVLAALLQDGCRHWQGMSPYKPNIPPHEQEQAFDDLCRVGPMLRHVCAFTGHDPDAVSEAFIRWCESEG